MRLSLLFLLISSCSTASREAVVLPDVAPGRILDAAALLLRDHEPVVEGNVLTTSWGPELESKEANSLLLGHAPVERARYRVTVLDGKVTAEAVIERRAMGGPRMLRWERVRSDGRRERELLNKIKESL